MEANKLLHNHNKILYNKLGHNYVTTFETCFVVDRNDTSS